MEELLTAEAPPLGELEASRPYPARTGPKGNLVYRLITTILDPGQAPAADLAAAYAQRWEIETVFDELKTHQGAPRMVLRSQSPPGAEQEVWGFLLVHYAVRALMSQAAQDAGLDPDRLSFTRSLRIARRQVTAQAALSPLAPGPVDRPGPN